MTDPHLEKEPYDHETEALFSKSDNSVYQIVARRDFSQKYLDAQSALGLNLAQTAEEADAVLTARSTKNQEDVAAREKRDAAKLLENRKIEQEKITLNNSAYAKHVKIAGVDAYTPEEWQLQTGILPSVKEVPKADKV